LNETVGGNSRENNRLRILETLLREPARSRGDLGRTLGLSRATIASVLLELEQAGIVEQQPDGPADTPRALGRPPLQVSLAPGAALAVGLDFGHRHIRAAVCDLSGAQLASRWAESPDDQPLVSLDLAQRLVADTIAEAGVDTNLIVGVGVGLATPVDSAHGTIHPEGILPGWHGIRPAEELEERLGLPVLIENDANAGALGEHIFGAGRGTSEIVYVRLSAGVGVGMIIGGRLHRGVAGVAGEIGHTRAVEGGLICRCGNRGCLETIASPVAVTELLERSRRQPVSFPQLLELLDEGDRGARRAVADAGRVVGRALAATVNVLNPGLVIIGGELALAGPVLLDPIRAAISEHAVVPAATAVRVVASELGPRAEVLGAATIQLARAPEALASRVARVQSIRV
jgi:predicted NBD/HSP70 family sugar kinase